ncbi:carbohydrate ABC transporter permease [Microvirga puerhi]|uniref:Carbohydrate ABC transporter permease n=1 Tax=Microvirga puerhi TaxID=2876078 RepID=A0ABS7VSZ5_9HYPH|nr:carbohydrate ABC transporter permease [Microvirga puerhi]MBZ6078692.1 carbohydrate ABC transporter permease [Microvirga puerhi]
MSLSVASSTTAAATKVSAQRKVRPKLALKRVLLYVSLWVAFVWSVFPFYWMIATSLRAKADIFRRPPSIVPQGITLQNYVDLLVSAHFWRFAMNSLILTLSVTLISVFISVTAGYAMARHRFKGSVMLPLFMLYGQMFPPVLLLIPFYVQLRYLGWLDSLYGLIPVYLSYMLPLCVWLMRGFFSQVPHSLEDAARMDGCTRWQAFWKVILPMAQPGIVAVATWVMIHSWNEFLYASTFILSEKNRTLPLGLSKLIGQYTTDWGVLMAGGVVTAAPIVLVFFFLQKHLVAGVGGGAVKG